MNFSIAEMKETFQKLYHTEADLPAEACKETTPTAVATTVLPNHFFNLLISSSHIVEIFYDLI